MSDTSALDGAMTPAAAVAKLHAAGIQVSERTLRERARTLGACRIIGKAMFLLPADIDTILEASKPKPKVRYDVSPYEPQPAPIKRWTEYDTDALLRRLEKPKRTKGRPAKGSTKAKRP